MLTSFSFDPVTGEYVLRGKVGSQTGVPSSSGKNNLLDYLQWTTTDQLTASGAPIKLTATLAIPAPTAPQGK